MTNELRHEMRRALLRLLDSFRRDGTPADAIGLHSHLRLDGAAFEESIYRAAVALGQMAVISAVSWGLSDRYPWLMAQRDRSCGRAGGMASRPLPFEDSVRPKTAYYALLSVFNDAPRRKAA